MVEKESLSTCRRKFPFYNSWNWNLMFSSRLRLITSDGNFSNLMKGLLILICGGLSKYLLSNSSLEDTSLPVLISYTISELALYGAFYYGG